VTERQRRPWYSWRRWGGRVLIVLVLALAGWLIAQEYSRHRGEQEYRDLVAKLDARYPNGWRLEALQAQLPPLPPPEENGALQIAKLAREYHDWPCEQLLDLWRRLEPQTRLTADQVEVFRGTLAKFQTEREMLGQFVEPKPGRYPIEFQTKVLDTLLPHLSALKVPAYLMAFEAALRAEEGDRDGAVAAVKIILHTTRWVREEWGVLSQLSRTSSVLVAGRTIERLLAQGELTPDQLAYLQRLLEENEAAPYYSTGLRGDLAMQDRFYENIANGTLTYEESVPEGRRRSSWRRRLEEFPFVRWHLPSERATTLRFTWMGLLATDLPEEQQYEAVQEVQTAVDSVNQPGGRTSTPLALRFEKIFLAFHRTHAQQRSLIAALAAERFRLANGRWPNSLVELTPAFLGRPLTDPWTGGPLQFRRLQDGLVIYSVGRDREDNGGEFNREQLDAAGTDEGCRLWDVAKRRQPPPPAPPKLAPEDQP
jgi:hypothetical protein